MDSVGSKREHGPFQNGILQEQNTWNLFLLIPRGRPKQIQYPGRKTGFRDLSSGPGSMGAADNIAE